MSENTETVQSDPTTILRSLITPRVLVALLDLTDEELAAIFVTASQKYGVRDTFTADCWRMLARRISRAMSRKS